MFVFSMVFTTKDVNGPLLSWLKDLLGNDPVMETHPKGLTLDQICTPVGDIGDGLSIPNRHWQTGKLMNRGSRIFSHQIS